MQEKQVKEAETKVESYAKKIAADLEKKGQPFRWKMIQGTADALMESIGEFMPADIALVGKLEWFLWATAVGTYLFAGALFIVSRLRQRHT